MSDIQGLQSSSDEPTQPHTAAGEGVQPVVDDFAWPPAQELREFPMITEDEERRRFALMCATRVFRGHTATGQGGMRFVLAEETTKLADKYVRWVKDGTL